MCYPVCGMVHIKEPSFSLHVDVLVLFVRLRINEFHQRPQLSTGPQFVGDREVLSLVAGVQDVHRLFPLHGFVNLLSEKINHRLDVTVTVTTDIAVYRY